MANPQMFVEVVTSGAQASVTVVGHGDDVGDAFGDDEDFVIVLNSSANSANTGITGVLEGTPVTNILAVNSAILSNTTTDGDILFAVSDGGTSKEFLFANGDSADLQIGHGMATATLKTASGNLTLAPGGELILGSATGVAQMQTNGVTFGLAASAPAPDGNAVHIWGGSAGTLTAETDSLLILETDAANNRLSFLGDNTQAQRIVFGDEDDNNVGGLFYRHDGDTIDMVIAAGTQYVFSATNANFSGNTLSNVADTGNDFLANGITYVATGGMSYTRVTASASELEVLKLKADGDSINMDDAFGAAMSFTLRDVSNSDKTIGYLGFSRNGADNNGVFQVYCVDGGVKREVLRVDEEANLQLAFTGSTTGSPLVSVVHQTTKGTGILSLFDGTPPEGTLASGASIYCDSGVMKVINADGSGGTIDFS